MLAHNLGSANLRNLSGCINLNVDSDSEPNLGITRLGMVRAEVSAYGFRVQAFAVESVIADIWPSLEDWR